MIKEKPEQCDSGRNLFFLIFLYYGVINSRQSEDFDNHGLKIINERYNGKLRSEEKLYTNNKTYFAYV